jgi:hypothetical protein
MQKVPIMIFVAVVVCVPQILRADIIRLKSGKTIEGKIIERTAGNPKIDIQGASLMYSLDEIADIQQEPITSASKAQETAPVQERQDSSIQVENSTAKKTDIAAPSLSDRNLPFSTVVIKYQVSGEIYNGAETVYVDVQKNTVSRDVEVQGKVNDQTIEIKSRDINDGKTMRHTDLIEKIAFSTEVKEGDAISNMFNKDRYLGCQKEQGSFLGKECDVYTMPGAKAFFWNDILMKEDLTNLSKEGQVIATKTAVDITLDVPVSEDKFSVPPGVKSMTLDEALGFFREKMQGIKP